jgi:gamma-glutamylcyclotransferase
MQSGDAAMLYFAYGSNLDATQMRLRCPEARHVGKARVDDYRFCFPVWSRIRQSGLISIEPSAGDRVWGVLYELPDGDLPRLDHREGYDPDRSASRNAFNRVGVKVSRRHGKTAQAETYVARPAMEPRLPSADYIAFLVQLATACGLPEDYRAKLRGVRVAALAA